MNYNNIDTKIPILGKSKIASPIQKTDRGSYNQNFIFDNDRVLIDVNLSNVTKMIRDGKKLSAFELAGPRKKIYFDPSKLRCALVACGGLCPGVNGIIRSIVLELYYAYGVQNIYGIQHGLQGFIPEYGHDILPLTPETVEKIIRIGGSFLGSSRGPQDINKIVDCMERMNIGALFMIGGDGTLMAASKINDVLEKRGLKISIIGIPKTIDNDIYMVSRSFGFDTAVDIATQSIRAAHNEAQGYPNGIGLIKLMGRHSGFIAATAALAQQDVNFVLIPEVEIDLKGPGGFLSALEKRIKSRSHAVIVAAEGAGQNLFKTSKNKKNMYDESGNIRLQDIGLFLKDAITTYFKEKNISITLKYIDPSYIIRSLPANSNDHVFCSFLGRDAVHAAMTGRTNMLIGHWNDHFVHIPISLPAGKRKKIDPHGKLWLNVLEATGQGSLKNN